LARRACGGPPSRPRTAASVPDRCRIRG
jgi:hypothetical protein